MSLQKAMMLSKTVMLLDIVVSLLGGACLMKFEKGQLAIETYIMYTMDRNTVMTSRASFQNLNCFFKLIYSISHSVFII